jgi:hypothetical protein|nr:MAG TPA: hypothetical protein [Caudoviricetes sp.]
MRLLDTPSPKKGTWAYKFVAWFCNNVNFCHGYLYDTDIEKPDNKIYNAVYRIWLFPFKQNDCICCNTVRGLIYGAVLGYLLGSF